MGPHFPAGQHAPRIKSDQSTQNTTKTGICPWFAGIEHYTFKNKQDPRPALALWPGSGTRKEPA
jgi:hypothetical protein